MKSIAAFRLRTLTQSTSIVHCQIWKIQKLCQPHYQYTFNTFSVHTLYCHSQLFHILCLVISMLSFCDCNPYCQGNFSVLEYEVTSTLLFQYRFSTAKTSTFFVMLRKNWLVFLTKGSWLFYLECSVRVGVECVPSLALMKTMRIFMSMYSGLFCRPRTHV